MAAPPLSRLPCFLGADAAAGQHHDGGRIVGGARQLTAERQAVEAGQLHVEQHDGRPPETGDLACLPDIVGKRFFAIDMFALAHGGNANVRMVMVRRCAKNGIDVSTGMSPPTIITKSGALNHEEDANRNHD